MIERTNPAWSHCVSTDGKARNMKCKTVQKDVKESIAALGDDKKYGLVWFQCCNKNLIKKSISREFEEDSSMDYSKYARKR